MWIGSDARGEFAAVIVSRGRAHAEQPTRRPAPSGDGEMGEGLVLRPRTGSSAPLAWKRAKAPGASANGRLVHSQSVPGLPRLPLTRSRGAEPGSEVPLVPVEADGHGQGGDLMSVSPTPAGRACGGCAHGVREQRLEEQAHHQEPTALAGQWLGSAQVHYKQNNTAPEASRRVVGWGGRGFPRSCGGTDYYSVPRYETHVLFGADGKEPWRACERRVLSPCVLTVSDPPGALRTLRLRVASGGLC
ncbi:hypothetical protein TOPH_03664 [Tolypocladium ophioglossoides CBS 100239]|uniref:Uncharacterized protein n=1 Tax=Tolypocladium ophioglossoides (strain CBS 100239) TaxID=1163406 RepID=A0A0L0ND94_TOLOC|nr:hypothetical protein TOPH_03664 [Tolypocladium ophioglossoides CBS 100239]